MVTKKEHLHLAAEPEEKPQAGSVMVYLLRNIHTYRMLANVMLCTAVERLPFNRTLEFYVVRVPLPTVRLHLSSPTHAHLPHTEAFQSEDSLATADRNFSPN